jgi:hypothetical protein
MKSRTSFTFPSVASLMWFASTRTTVYFPFVSPPIGVPPAGS